MSTATAKEIPVGTLILDFVDASDAWPAQYGATGIQTFIVSHDAIVYQKDLGPDTAKVASAMTLYNPDKTWHATEDQAAERE